MAFDAAGAQFETDRRRQRFWAIPILGGMAKAIILIPHFIILAVLSLLFSPTITLSSNPGSDDRGVQLTAAGLAFLILWVPVLFGGRMPEWGYGLVGGYLRWSVRVFAFFVGLTDRYPPFSMRSAEHPVAVTFHIPESNNRWWAVPVLGFYVKQLILVPHFICIVAISIVVFALWLVMWIPVLISGQYPAGPYYLAAGLSRWTLRVSAFQGGLTDRYPPFSLD
jgi:hypothetical protein